jgi:methylated-DNA-protein-cysteine methyltransferase-like protein
VASYGQVAREAGLGRGARLVGRALGAYEGGEPLPWHRVINAQGRISLPPGSRAALEQRRRLENEGVVFVDGRVAMRRFAWQPSLDELLWGAPPEPAD